MITLREKAYAKINLTLDVLSRRPDGYHDLKGVMQSVTLGDDIEIDLETGKGWQLCCCQEGVPCDSRNLAWKAAALFFQRTGHEPGGITIRITKNVPSGAGMGGGSADAAAVLRALNRYCDSPYTVEELAALGAEVGSDVPFCVMMGTAVAEGRGEILRRLPDMPKCPIVLCKPEFSISTPVLFRRLDAEEILCRPDHAAMEKAICHGSLREIAAQVRNVFEPAVGCDHPEIQHIKGICMDSGALAAQMTGSGSVVFALMPDSAAAQLAQERLLKYYPQTFLAEPV